MPTVHREGEYTFIFFSSDKGEPVHIHVKRERRIAKFWLSPVALAKNRGFPGHELNQIAQLVAKNESKFLEAWNDYFNS
jgi:rRNA maturation protein Rpf1